MIPSKSRSTNPNTLKFFSSVTTSTTTGPKKQASDYGDLIDANTTHSSRSTGTNSCDAAIPPPVLSRQRPVQQQPQQPGAYRGSVHGRGTEQVPILYKGGVNVLGREGNASSDDDNNEEFAEECENDDNNNRPNREENCPGPIDHDDEEAASIFSAQCENAETNSSEANRNNNDNKSLKAWYWHVIVMTLVLGIAIAIVLGILLGSDSSSPEERETIGGSAPALPNSTSEEWFQPLDTVFTNPQDLELIPISTRQAIESQDMSLPQVQAYQWLLQDDNLQRYEASQLRQRLALATLFFSTDGPNWFNDDNEGDSKNNNWLDYNTHECSWFSLAPSRNSSTCYNFTPPADDTNPWSLHFDFRSLVLPGDLKAEANPLIPQLKGTLVPELAMLSSLELLDVSYQKLRGTIPTELSRLSSTLLYIGLRNCFFTGTIPDEIYKFPSQLVLSHNNRLDPGTIPTTIGLNTHLTRLLLADTNRQGPIPTTMVVASTNLRHLDLQQNQFSGTIPSQLGQLQALEMLLLGQNPITGTLPTSLSLLSNLRRLEANQNFLDGALSPELFATRADGSTLNATTTTRASYYHPTWPKLRVLNLSWNNLPGTIPTQIGLLECAEIIWLYYNKFTSSIPSEVGQLSQLQLLDLGGNRALSGQLPSELGLLTALTLLGLDQNNQISGTIPEALCNQSNFKEVGPLECTNETALLN